MPRNTEYLIAAYGIVASVLTIYVTVTLVKLREINQKLKKLNREKGNE